MSTWTKANGAITADLPRMTLTMRVAHGASGPELLLTAVVPNSASRSERIDIEAATVLSAENLRALGEIQDQLQRSALIRLGYEKHHEEHQHSRRPHP